MAAPVDVNGRGTTLLTVHAGTGAWAIPSSAVQSVERLPADAASDAPDALSLLGMTGSQDLPRRVAVVRAEGQHARVLVRGSIGLTDATAEELLPLPAELAGAAPLVSHVAVLAGRPALFVVSPERLLHASRQTAHDSTLNDTDAVRGNSC